MIKYDFNDVFELCVNVGRASSCTTIPVSVRKLGKGANPKAGRTFYSRDDQSEYVCKSVVHHRLLLFISVPFGSSDMGCVSLWGKFKKFSFSDLL